MQPTLTEPRADGFKPKYRHFHPNSRIWVKNPFDHDVVYQVADEYNRPFRYRLPCRDRNGNLGCISELPGGAIATLGVKAIVDELIQNDEKDSALMWDERIRTKHEKTIIEDERSTSPKVDADRPGEVNLESTTTQAPQDVPEEPAPPEEAFPGLNQPAAEPVGKPQSAPLPAPAAQGLDGVVAASLPSSDTVVAPNADHANADG